MPEIPAPTTRTSTGWVPARGAAGAVRVMSVPPRRRDVAHRDGTEAGARRTERRSDSRRPSAVGPDGAGDQHDARAAPPEGDPRVDGRGRPDPRAGARRGAGPGRR